MRKYALLPAILLPLSIFVACHSSSGDASRSEKIKVMHDAVAIDYSDTGKGDITLLFIHGWGINKTYWQHQIDHYASQYRVVAMDLPGFGASGKNRHDYTTATFGKDVQALIDQLGLKKVILIGHSMAGEIIVAAANDAPAQVIGLVGIDNFKDFGHQPDSAEKAQYAAAIGMLKTNFKEVVTQYCNESLFYTTTDSAVRKRVLSDMLGGDSVIAVEAMEPSGFDGVSQLASAKKKLYLVNSDVTPTDTIGFIKNKIPYEVLSIHATGHYPMIEKPDEFNALLDQAITQISQSAK